MSQISLEMTVDRRSVLTFTSVTRRFVEWLADLLQDKVDLGVNVFKAFVDVFVDLVHFVLEAFEFDHHVVIDLLLPSLDSFGMLLYGFLHQGKLFFHCILDGIILGRNNQEDELSIQSKLEEV